MSRDAGAGDGGETRGDVSWTLLDVDGLVDAYWDVVAPAVRDAGFDPLEDRPTHAWLSANGFRGLVYALREYHDRSFGEFWAADLGLEAADRYDWGVDHDGTVELLEAYLESRRDRGDLGDSSVDTTRYRLAAYVRAYRATNGTGDLITPVAPGSDAPPHDATDAAWAAFDRLDDGLASRTLRRVHGAVDDWYAHLVRRKRAVVNPVSGLEDEYRWSRRVDDGATNPALDAGGVRALYDAASDARERLLVVALCAWGLRSGEVARLHRDQLVLDDPGVGAVTFGERKNGPGSVSILYGRDDVEDRLTALDSRDGWNGFLFPSERSSSGHVSRQTVLRWFDDLAGRGGVGAVAGQKPVPQMGRRFWYDAYTATREALLAEVEEIAAEQGSASAEVVLREYLSPERRRRLRRVHMRDRLAAAFDGSGS